MLRLSYRGVDSMGKLMLSADSDVMLYEVDKKILNDFDSLIDEFYEWKQTNCFTEQLFVEFLQEKFGNEAIKFIKNLGWIYGNIPEEYKDIE